MAARSICSCVRLILAVVKSHAVNAVLVLNPSVTGGRTMSTIWLILADLNPSVVDDIVAVEVHMLGVTNVHSMAHTCSTSNSSCMSHGDVLCLDNYCR